MLVQYSIDRSQYIEERKVLPVDDILLVNPQKTNTHTSKNIHFFKVNLFKGLASCHIANFHVVNLLRVLYQGHRKYPNNIGDRKTNEQVISGYFHYWRHN